MFKFRTTFTTLLALGLSVHAAGIRTSQLGYYPNGNKFFMVPNAPSDSFFVKDAATGSTVLAGKLSNPVLWTASNENVQTGDFTSLRTEGFYYINVKNVGNSDPFRIRKDVYSKPYFDAQRAYYYWRASDSIPASFGGIFARAFGHADTGLQYHSALGKPAGATRNVAHGWYDAGDYGKYVVNAGVTMGLLNDFVEMRPTWSGDAVLNIPETGNGVPDLMDEMHWELDWLFTMQDDDGGVFFKVTPKVFAGFVLPSKDPSVRYVIGKSTSSSLDFAAIMAQSSRRWRAYDVTMADSMITVAKKAYAWAVANPNSQYNQGAGTSYPDVSTGGYGDNNFTDEFYWAQTELWLSTGESTYKPKASQIGVVTQADWPNVGALAAYSLALEAGASPDAALQSAAVKAVQAAADTIVSQISTDPYRLPAMGFGWGSNGTLGSQAMNLLVSFQITGDSSYIRAADEIAQYFFGKNPLSISYVTGEGVHYSKTPHSRIMVGDGIAPPIPGYVVGGPNSSPPSGDAAYTILQGCLPALCYDDLWGSYSTNEIAINWQAPLVALLGMVESTLGGSSQLTLDTLAPQVFIDAQGGSVALSPQKASYNLGDTLRIQATPNDSAVFLGWGGGMLGGVLADTFVVLNSDFSAKAYFQFTDTNLIKNGTFTDSLNDWTASNVSFDADGNFGLAQALWTADHAMQIQPLDPGDKIADASVYQNGLLLGAGQTYTLEFDAIAPANKGISVALVPTTGSTTTIKFAVDTTNFHTRYSFLYSNITDPGVQFKIQVGGDPSNVTFDNISLKLVTGTPPENTLGVLGSNMGNTFEQAKLVGHLLQLSAPQGTSLRVDLYSMTGQSLGNWQGVSHGMDYVDLNTMSAHRGVDIVKVTTAHGNYTLRWVNAE